MTKYLGAFWVMMICLAPSYVHAQNVLDKKISLEVSNRRLSDVLKMISNKGDFYFSYNSNIINRDSLVSLTASNKSVNQILDQLFNDRYSWKPLNNYVILRKAVVKPEIASPTKSEDKVYTVSGFVLNGETGEKISNASIYEKQRLASTLTDEKGFFKIRLRSRYSTATLTISREFFEDTTVMVQPKYNQQVTIVMDPVPSNEPVVTISPVDINLPDTIEVKPPSDSLIAVTTPAEEVNRVEKTSFGRFLLSAKQNVQSLNLRQFFADRTFQISLTPGLSTHGKLSAQVVNHFSVNVLGGYTAGVDGMEAAGIFNINKKDVRYLQASGFLNIVGGSVTGLQASGFHNNVLGNVLGLQAAGFSNFVRGDLGGLQASGMANHISGALTGLQVAGFWNYANHQVKGMQVSGFHNHGSDSVTGWQVAGFSNFARKQMTGAQISGFGNFANREMTGVQLAPFFNYAKRLKGLQIGLINVADTSSGYSLGLINIIFKGYHKLALYTNEVLPTNIAFKTGNSKLYSILLMGFGANEEDEQKIVSAGYGLGHEISLSKRFSINPEFTTQYLYLGQDNATNFMSKLHLQFVIRFGRFFSIYGGPSFTAYYSDQTTAADGWKFKVPSVSYHTFDLWNNTKGWIGWNAGIAIF